MTLGSEGAADDRDLTYSFRPSLMGAPRIFTLTDRGIDWSAGNRSGRVLYRDVHRVRLSFKPVTMQSHRFLTEIWAENAPKLQISSASWKSMVEVERLDRAYAAFVTELHVRIARSALPEPVRYEQGANQFAYWPGVVLYILVALGLAAVFVRALVAHTLGAAAFIGAFVGLFLWQGGNFFRRNKPGTYVPDALLDELIPRV